MSLESVLHSSLRNMKWIDRKTTRRRRRIQRKRRTTIVDTATTNRRPPVRQCSLAVVLLLLKLLPILSIFQPGSRRIRCLSSQNIHVFALAFGGSSFHNAGSGSCRNRLLRHRHQDIYHLASFHSNNHPTDLSRLSFSLNSRNDNEQSHSTETTQNRSSIPSSSQSPQSTPLSTTTTTKIRLNKVLKATHSRRKADQLILDGRIKVNGVVSYGCMVVPFQDIVTLDDQPIVDWESWNGIELQERSSSSSISSGSSSSQKSSTRNRSGNNKKTQTSIQDSSSISSSSSSSKTRFAYIKYWKPYGVICTTDRTIRDNLLDRLERIDGCPVTTAYSRLFPVGRLDKPTTGLLLLTNDGRLPNAALRKQYKQIKVYNVQTMYDLTDDDLETLRRGVVITTIAQRDGKSAKPLTAPTLPCRVERMNIMTKGSQRHNNNNNNNNINVDNNSSWDRRRNNNEREEEGRRTNREHENNRCRRSFRIYLTEGRNRQIRKMVEAIGNEVTKLHRIQFGGTSDNGDGRDNNDYSRTNNSNRDAPSPSTCISLRGLRGPGDWQELQGRELELIQEILQRAEMDGRSK